MSRSKKSSHARLAPLTEEKGESTEDDDVDSYNDKFDVVTSEEMLGEYMKDSLEDIPRSISKISNHPHKSKQERIGGTTESKGQILYFGQRDASKSQPSIYAEEFENSGMNTDTWSEDSISNDYKGVMNPEWQGVVEPSSQSFGQRRPIKPSSQSYGGAGKKSRGTIDESWQWNPEIEWLPSIHKRPANQLQPQTQSQLANQLQPQTQSQLANQPGNQYQFENQWASRNVCCCSRRACNFMMPRLFPIFMINEADEEGKQTTSTKYFPNREDLGYKEERDYSFSPVKNSSVKYFPEKNGTRNSITSDSLRGNSITRNSTIRNSITRNPVTGNSVAGSPNLTAEDLAGKPLVTYSTVGPEDAVWVTYLSNVCSGCGWRHYQQSSVVNGSVAPYYCAYPTGANDMNGFKPGSYEERYCNDGNDYSCDGSSNPNRKKSLRSDSSFRQKRNGLDSGEIEIYPSRDRSVSATRPGTRTKSSICATCGSSRHFYDRGTIPSRSQIAEKSINTDSSASRLFSSRVLPVYPIYDQGDIKMSREDSVMIPKSRCTIHDMKSTYSIDGSGPIPSMTDDLGYTSRKSVIDAPFGSDASGIQYSRQEFQVYPGKTYRSDACNCASKLAAQESQGSGSHRFKKKQMEAGINCSLFSSQTCRCQDKPRNQNRMISAHTLETVLPTDFVDKLCNMEPVCPACCVEQPQACCVEQPQRSECNSCYRSSKQPTLTCCDTCPDVKRRVMKQNQTDGTCCCDKCVDTCGLRKKCCGCLRKKKKSCYR